MSIGHCSCPECGTTLRIRDRSFVGRQIECPDCQAKLLISVDAERNVIAERVRQPDVKKPVTPPVVAPAVKAGTAVGRKLGGLLRSPLAIAWALGIGMTAFVAIILLRPNVRLRPAAEKPAVPVAANESIKPPAPPAQDETVEPIAEEPITPPETATVVTPPAVVKAGPESDTRPEEVPSAVNPASAKPIAPAVALPTAPVPVKIQVEELFKQPIKAFSTGKPLSREELIEVVEEMLGAPIRYDREKLGAKDLDRTVSITLEGTTVGGVLKALLDSAGWDYVIEDDGIRLKQR